MKNQTHVLLQNTGSCRAAFLSWVILFGILFHFTNLAHATEVTLSWDPNTESDLAGYKIYYGLQTRNYIDRIDVGNQTTYTVTGIMEDQTVYFAATAYDVNGNESDYSQEVVYPASNQYPTLSITANNSDGTVQVFRRKPVSISISVDPVDLGGQIVDLWLVADAPNGRWYYVEGFGWYDQPTPGAQTSIDAGISTTPFNDNLPVGNYTFIFAIDNNSDGIFDGTWTDTVSVEVW